MKKNNFLKIFLLLGGISLVGFISTIVVSCGVKKTTSNPVDPTKPNKPGEDSENKPDKPNTVPDKPDTVPDKPDTVPDKHDTAPDKPDTAPDKPDTTPEKPINPNTPDKNNKREERIKFLAKTLNSVDITSSNARYLNVYTFSKDNLEISYCDENLFTVDVQIVKRDNKNGSVTVSFVVSEKNGDLKSETKEVTIKNFKILSDDDDILQKELLNIKLDYPNKANVEAKDAFGSVIMITGYNNIRFEAEVYTHKPNPKNQTELIVEVVMRFRGDNSKDTSFPVTRILTGFKSP